MEKKGWITEWVEEVRGDGRAGLPDAVANALSRRLYRVLARRVRERIVPQFGLPTPAEMAGEQVILLLRRLDAAGAGLPPFVTDSRTLFYWMYRTAWRRFLDRLESRASRPQEHGFSGAARVEGDGGGDCDARGLQNVVVEPYRGDALAVGELGTDVVEVLRAALEDARRWFRAESRGRAASRPAAGEPKDWAYAFERVVIDGTPSGRVAADVGIDPGNVTRWVDRVRFCVARRLGFERDQLVKQFGESTVGRWTAGLEAALNGGES